MKASGRRTEENKEEIECSLREKYRLSVRHFWSNDGIGGHYDKTEVEGSLGQGRRSVGEGISSRPRCSMSNRGWCGYQVDCKNRRKVSWVDIRLSLEVTNTRYTVDVLGGHHGWPFFLECR
jgi:hypothetical protein